MLALPTKPLSSPPSLEDTLGLLKAMGETTRLRILCLLNDGELSVKELTQVLGQSQPRLSRHLKLLADAGLVERHPEGAWAYFRMRDDALVSPLMAAVTALLDEREPILVADRERLDALREQRAQAAADYFNQHAEAWDEIRALHVGDEHIERAIIAAAGDQVVSDMLDMGTGTGRMLELFRDHYANAVGIDLSHEMLTVARAKLDRQAIIHAQVRHGDVCNMPFASASFELIVIHQVLHFLTQPERAIAEAARVLAPGGRLIIVDFAPHDLEFLRHDHAHHRLGLADVQVRSWLTANGLRPLDTRHLVPDQANKDMGLTVSIWSAQDPRLVIAQNGEQGAPAQELRV